MEELLHALELTMATGHAPKQVAIDGCLKQLPPEKHEKFWQRYRKLLEQYSLTEEMRNNDV